VLQQIIIGLLFEIQKVREERMGKKEHNHAKLALIRDISQMLIDLNYYKSQFEERLCDKLSLYYRNHVLQAMKNPNQDIEQYLENSKMIIDQECEFAMLYLTKKSLKPLINKLQEVLIKDKSKEILERGLFNFITNHRFKTLLLLF